VKTQQQQQQQQENMAFYQILDTLCPQHIHTKAQSAQNVWLIVVISLINSTHDLQQTVSLQSLHQHSAASSDCHMSQFVQTLLSAAGILFTITPELN
jgi:hypothetical protein